MAQSYDQTKAQQDWTKEFRRRLDEVESVYHFWQSAEDRRRANRLAEEQERLDYLSTVKQNIHSDELRWFTEWVQANPYPAADQTAQTDEEAGAETHPPADVEQYRNGWSGAMLAVEDTLRRHTGADARAYADRLRLASTEVVRAEPSDDYARGTVHAMVHFLNTGQTDKAPQIVCFATLADGGQTDQAPTQTVADSLRKVNRLANLATQSNCKTCGFHPQFCFCKTGF